MPLRTLRIGVGIPTIGRRDVLAKTISVIGNQTRVPDLLVICPTVQSDVDDVRLSEFPGATTVVFAEPGSSTQRNAILRTISNFDVVVFLDDDFFPDRRYLELLETIFVANADVVGVTGTLIADGAQGPGISVEDALGLLAKDAAPRMKGFIEHLGTYGCNMAFRLQPIAKHEIMFDENLPLYAWQEDIDFSLRVGLYGRTIKSADLRGVHLGVKAGRTSGVRFGYSQVINPLYLVLKGSMPWPHAAKLMSRNLFANLLKSIRPEEWIDRRGRLRGNFIALGDLMHGRVSPSRILQIK